MLRRFFSVLAAISAPILFGAEIFRLPSAQFTASDTCSYPCSVAGDKALEIRFTLELTGLPEIPAGAERRINPVFSLNDRRTLFSMAVVQYPKQQKQLINITSFQPSGGYTSCNYRVELKPGTPYQVRIVRTAEKLSLELDGKEVCSAPCKAGFDCTGLTIGDHTKRSTLPMTVRDFIVDGSPVAKINAFDYPMTPKMWHTNVPKRLSCRELPGGKLEITFKGGTAAVLSATKPVFLKPGDNHIRTAGKYRVLQSEYGSMLSFRLNNSATKPIGFTSGNRYPAPNFQSKPADAPDEFDFSFAFRENEPVTLQLLFYGNPQTIVLESAKIFSADIVRRGRPEPTPENRSYDRAAVEASLAKMAPVQYKLERRGNRVELLLDGKRVPPAIYRRGFHYPHWTRYGEFGKNGINTVMVFAFLNPASAMHKMNIGGMWLGKDRYDFSKLGEELRVIHAINPQARVIVILGVEPYDGWEKDYPEAVFTNTKGENGYGLTTAKIVFYGKQALEEKRKHPHEEFFAVPSNYSEEYRREVSKAARAFAEYLDRDPAGKIVFGVHVIGSADGQFFPYDRDATCGEDHSPAAKRAWSQYLRKKYGSVEKLRDAWHNSKADFDNPGVPDKRERGYDNSGAQPTMRGKDYMDFISDALTEVRLAIFKAIKEGSKGRLMCGSYGPPESIGNIYVDRLVSSPYTDFHIDIKRATPAGSYQLRNKLYIGELDIRVPTAMTPIGNYTFDWDAFESLVRFSEVTTVQREGGMFHLFDIGEAYYADPRYPKFFGKVLKEIESCIDSSLYVAPQLGVFRDYQRLNGHSYRSCSHLKQIMEHAISDLTERSGIPAQSYFAADALDEKLALPKILWFPITPDFTPEQIARLRARAKAAGSVIIWGYYRPFAAGKASAFAGYRFRYQRKPDLPQLRAVKHPLTEGVEGKILGESYTGFSHNHAFQMSYEQAAAFEVQSGDEVLARYDKSGDPGMILRRVDGVTEIAVGAPGALSPRVLRNVARSAGAEVLSDNDNLVVFVEAGMLSCHCIRGGEIEVSIPTGFTVVSCATGQKFTVDGQKLRFRAAMDGENAFFKMKRQDR